MIKHYKIIPISSYNRNMYDTIAEVANAAGIPYSKLMNSIDINSARYRMMNKVTNYFSIENLMTCRLNNYCKMNDLDIRISRPIVRRPVNEVSDNSENSRRDIMGWR